MPDKTTGKVNKPSIQDALGQSEAFLEFQDQISKVARIDRPVLIIGERGTGKELAASRIHFLSRRWQKPLVTLNCAALTSTLIGSELFGYEKGAFTGAVSRRAGRFEMASEGTLFLDEIGAIPLEVQEKILRVVEYGSFERVGSSRMIHVDVRMVAATNVDLPKMAKSGQFKQDLLDRLSFEVVYVPPLRHRQSDILMLANHFAARMAFELGREEMPEISLAAEKSLKSYPWPGNIRELKNVIERAVYKSESHMVNDILFDPFESGYRNGLENSQKTTMAGLSGSVPDVPDTEMGDTSDNDVMKGILGLPFKDAIGKLEFYLVENALKESQFHQKKAARALGLTYDQFRGVRKKYAHRL